MLDPSFSPGNLNGHQSVGTNTAAKRLYGLSSDTFRTQTSRSRTSATAPDATKGAIMANEPKDGPEEDDQSGHEREQAAGKKVDMATQYSDRIRKKKVEPEGPQLSQNLQGHLGRQLRAVYSELIHEPMPDKFSRLLEELAASQKEKSKQQEQE